jgi:hypothetical protein
LLAIDGIWTAALIGAVNFDSMKSYYVPDKMNQVEQSCPQLPVIGDKACLFVSSQRIFYFGHKKPDP